MPSPTKAELQSRLTEATVTIVTLNHEIEHEYEYLSPAEYTALEKYHRAEIWVWKKVAEHHERAGEHEQARSVREELVAPHERDAARYALKAAERTVEWDRENAAESGG